MLRAIPHMRNFTRTRLEIGLVFTGVIRIFRSRAP